MDPMFGDRAKGHVPTYPARRVTRHEYDAACKRERRYVEEFIWIAKGTVHRATVAYDCNQMAIGYIDNGEAFLYEDGV